MEKIAVGACAGIDAEELVRRVRALGPQTIVVDGKIYTLFVKLRELYTDRKNAYLAFRPHDPRLFIVEPFAEKATEVDPDAWTSGQAAEFSNRLDIAAMVQYLAEVYLHDDRNMMAAVRRLAKQIMATAVNTHGNMCDQFAALFEKYPIPAWATLKIQLEGGSMTTTAVYCALLGEFGQYRAEQVARVS